MVNLYAVREMYDFYDECINSGRFMSILGMIIVAGPQYIIINYTSEDGMTTRQITIEAVSSVMTDKANCRYIKHANVR